MSVKKAASSLQSKAKSQLKIRSATKALIVQDHKLLTIVCRDAKYEWYILPGGGQEHSESLEKCLQRECREEINVDVDVHHMLFIREYIGKNHNPKHQKAHQIDFFFLCTIKDGQQPSVGATPDNHQVGVAWLDLATLTQVNFYPQNMRALLAKTLSGQEQADQPVYLGDIN